MGDGGPTNARDALERETEAGARAGLRAERVGAVRVVELEEHRGLAWILGLAGGLSLLGVVTYVFSPHEWLGVDKYWSAGVSLAVWCLGLLLGRRRAPYLLRGSAPELRELLDAAAGGVARPSVSVARGALGYSIAVVRGNEEKGFFIEVEREAEARALLARMGVAWPGTADVSMRVGPLRLGSARRVLAFCGMISALLYTLVVAGFGLGVYKGTFGVPALMAAILASVLFLVEPVFRSVQRVGKDTFDGRSRIAEHFRAHAWHPVDASTTTFEVDARVRLLDRNVEANETTEAWLARLDALGTGEQVYRSDAYGIEELRRIADDPTAPAGARLGALRLLNRMLLGIPEELRVRVAEDLGPRARIVVDDAATGAIAEELDALGPAFRARRNPRSS